MSKTFKDSSPSRSKLVKYPDRYTGWLGEQCWRKEGKRFIKRNVTRSERRYHDRCLKDEVNNHE